MRKKILLIAIYMPVWITRADVEVDQSSEIHFSLSVFLNPRVPATQPTLLKSLSEPLPLAIYTSLNGPEPSSEFNRTRYLL